MSFWQHIVSYFRRERPSDGAAFAPRLGAVSVWPQYPGVPPLSVSTVFCCVKLLSESVASLPVQYLKRRGDIFVDRTGDPLYFLLNVQPDTALAAFGFWRQIIADVLLDGNAYVVPVYNPVSMELDRLALCARGSVAHNTISDTYFVCDSINGVFGTYSESEIIHIKGMTTTDPKRGVSVLEYARTTTDIAGTGDRETLNRFANGGNVRGIVSNDTSVRGFGEYQDKQLEKTAENLDSRFQGGERIVSLPGQVDFKQLSLSSTDMQFLESRKFTVREICRFFGVHPSFVFDDTSNNYKSAEQANVAFLSHTLNPLLRNIEAEFNRKLIPRELSSKYKIQFDRRGLHVCDLDGVMNYRTKLLQTGTTVNEVRKMDNLPPVDGGDTVLVSANLRGINEIGVQPQQQSEAPENKDNDNGDEKE